MNKKPPPAEMVAYLLRAAADKIASGELGPIPINPHRVQILFCRSASEHEWTFDVWAEAVSEGSST